MKTRRMAAAAVCTAMVATLMALVGAPSAAAPVTSPAAPARSVTTTAELATALAPASEAIVSAARVNRDWRIHRGPTFNDPRNGDAWKIIDKIKRTIKNTPGGEKIRIMVWNLQSPGITHKLIQAHKRGVSVRLIMSRGLAREQGSHNSFWTLKRALKHSGNRKRPHRMRSWARTCSHSCRGNGASMHSKLLMVTQSGVRKRIISQGSANFTGASATRQWNDWYTIFQKRKIWRAYKKMFNQARTDKPYREIRKREGRSKAYFAPHTDKPDPVLKMLSKVKCKGARGAGINGRTAIRIASAVWEDGRGARIARKVKRLHNHGCNIKIVFTMMPNRIRKILAGIRMRHLAFDWDDDGGYDRYLHMKAMTISGHWGSDRGERLVFQSSANWDWLGKASDEQSFVFWSDYREKQYGRQINKLYRIAPAHGRQAMRPHDRSDYEGLELELAGQG